MRLQQVPRMCLRYVIKNSRVINVCVLSAISACLFVIFYLANNQLPVQDRMLSFGRGKDIHYQLDDLQRSAKRSDGVSSSCSEQKNFVFIKCMKCATSTLLGVFYRFGYTRNLTFVSPLGKALYLNWPFPMTVRDFRPSSRTYNILVDHAIYTEDVMESIMPKDTVYISIIRKPFDQLKSIFHYFKVDRTVNMTADVTNPVVEYFSHLEKYETLFKSPENRARWCMPDYFSITKNLMSHCHGMPLGFPQGTKDISNDTAAIEQYIQHLDSKFSLIMVAEYFYESLILLRRLMCWTFNDIIFITSNIGKYSYKDAKAPEFILEQHRNWSRADYMLYRYFNRTFWRHISRQGSEFNLEVETFKLVEARVQTYCHKLYSSFKREEYPENMTEIVLEETRWNKQFTITSKDCWVLGPNAYVLHYLVQKENDQREATLLEEMNKTADNRTMKGLC